MCRVIYGARFAEITDGLSNTLMVVEANEAVEWAKPDELALDPDKPLPKLGKQFPHGFNALFADGHVAAQADGGDRKAIARPKRARARDEKQGTLL